MRVAFAIVAIAAGAAGAGGCSEPTGPRTVDSELLTVKIPAIKEAARSRDMSAAPQLVTDLESDDAAVRLYAFGALRKLAGGETYGYVYYADVERRRPAVAKWQQWLRQQGAATRPAARE
jgi:hypothetical protein